MAAGRAGWGLSGARAQAAAPAGVIDSDGVQVAILDRAAEADIAAGLKARARKVVVTRFSVAADAGSRPRDVSSRGCPPGARAAAPGGGADAAAVAALDPKILDSIGARLSKRLARHVAVARATSIEAAPPGAVVVTGCITRFEAGSPIKRWAGLHYGASRLAAHVRVNEKLDGRLRPVAEFDVSVTGGSLLPPMSVLGVAVHAATMNRQTLAADARKLGNRVAYAIEDTFLPEVD
jgi:hypothetical protein